jgi:predicted TIM-barrel fold metal-dependent hydrolase
LTASVIDCDVHCSPPSVDELAPYLDAYWREELRLSSFNRPHAISYTYPPWSTTLGSGNGGSTLASLASTAMADVTYAVLHCYYGVESLHHPYLAPTLANAVNRWIEAEWLTQDARLLGSAVVAPQYADAAVEEVRRVATNSRYVEVLVPARAAEPYGARRYWPIWRAAEESGLAVAITFGGLTGTPPTPVNWLATFFEDYAFASQAFAAHVNSLVFSGIFDECPNLRFVLSESGWTWMPAVMWRMDWEWRAGHREVPWIVEPPSDYIRRHFRLTTQPTDAPAGSSRIRELADALGGAEMLMFGSDAPHLYESKPSALLTHFSAEEQGRLVRSNAIEWYGLGERGRA